MHFLYNNFFNEIIAVDLLLKIKVQIIILHYIFYNICCYFVNFRIKKLFKKKYLIIGINIINFLINNLIK